jgi:hypothetical protein
MELSAMELVTVQYVVESLEHLRRAEAETPEGHKITAYYLTDKQIRIDIVEKS